MGSLAFDFPVEKTLYRGLVSPNSYTFTETSTENEKICRDRLAELFGITNMVKVFIILVFGRSLFLQRMKRQKNGQKVCLIRLTKCN